MSWAKQLPNKPGYWLRVNAGHRVQLHKIWEDTGPHKGKIRPGLYVIWGWSGEERPCRIDEPKMEQKLKSFWWYGPLPLPPKEAL